MSKETHGIRLDLGCGRFKKEGTLGIDIKPFPGVDCIVDLEINPLPLADQSVSYVFSSHFLEHLRDPTHLFKEISRVCLDGARLEFLTPYGGSNPAFVLDHKTFYTEDIYLHMCVWYTDYWTRQLGVRWILHEFRYVIAPETLSHLKRRRIGLDFAIKHLRNVATEFWAYMTVQRHDLDVPAPPFRSTFSTERFGPRYPIQQTAVCGDQDNRLKRVIRFFRGR